MSARQPVPNDLDVPTAQRERKAYFTLAAQYALQGYELIRGDPEVTGQAPYYACRYSLFRPLASLDAAREYLAKLTRAGHGQELQAQ